MHHKLQLPLFFGLSGVYIFLKYTISPLLYLMRLLGLKSSLSNKIDFKINRTILPLTEKPDENVRMEINTSFNKGEKLPNVQIMFPDESFGALNTYTKSPLLLVFVRGSWCSYSRLHLSDLMSNKDKFEKAGIKLLAISSYKDQDWWLSKGIDIPMCIDAKGEVFNRFGIQVNSWIEFAWARILPHESVFLFNHNGILVSSDVRKVSGFVPGQRFLSSEKWLGIANKYL